MKKVNLFSILIIVSTMIIYSCEGPEGPVGPQGPTGSAGAAGAVGAAGKDGATGPAGAAGAAGATGAAGKDGNANVSTTAWRKLDLSNIAGNKNGAGEITSVSLMETKNPEPLFTKEVLDRDLIYTYVKYPRVEYAEDGAITLVDKYALLRNYEVEAPFLIPGRDKNNEENYRYLALWDIKYGVNTFKINGLLSLRRSLYNPVTQKNEAILPSEFLGKDQNYYKNIMENLVNIRHVIVKANQTGGRKNAVNMNDYLAVKAAFNLKD